MRVDQSLVRDSTRSKQRLKAIFRGRAIDTPGDGVYQAKNAGELLEQLENKGRKFRAKLLIEQIGMIDGWLLAKPPAPPSFWPGLVMVSCSTA